MWPVTRRDPWGDLPPTAAGASPHYSTREEVRISGRGHPATRSRQVANISLAFMWFCWSLGLAVVTGVHGSPTNVYWRLQWLSECTSPHTKTSPYASSGHWCTHHPPQTSTDSCSGHQTPLPPHHKLPTARKNALKTIVNWWREV